MAVKDLTSRLKKDTHSMTPNQDNVPSAPAPVPTVEPKTKKKLGRPKVKEGEYKTINISVPIPILEQMEVAKLTYGNNLTAYVNAVIKEDLDSNYSKYEQLQKEIELIHRIKD